MNNGVEILNILDNFKGKRIAVIGDVMLDYFIRGTVNRISPEAPVPIVDVIDESEHPGGAANVGYNIATLGGKAFLFGVIGNDKNGEHLVALLNKLEINTLGLIIDTNRPTTVKTRIIAGSQHVVRFDRESKKQLSENSLNQIVEKFNLISDNIDAVILQDYNKGVLQKSLIESIIKISNRKKIPILVDPKKDNFFEYKYCTIFKPNRKEAEEGLGVKLDSMDKLNEASKNLLSKINSKFVVITLSGEGMLISEQDKEIMHIPTNAIQVADVSGAGDTVIATLAVSIAAGATMTQAVTLSNYSAGIVCEQIGTVPIKFKELKNKFKLTD
jgi:rfaE bifunctional protein kinase chain/domain